MNDPCAIRAAIRSIALHEISVGGAPPDMRHVFAPPGHRRALQPNVALVVGTRGAGKTFWSSALRDPDVRRLVHHATDVNLVNVEVEVGHAERHDPDHYPDDDTLAEFARDGDPRTAWRAVIARWYERILGQVAPDRSWAETADRTSRDPEAFARLAGRANTHLRDTNRHALLVFDALDRIGDDWRTRAASTKGLLQVLLQLRSYDRLHGKAFLRNDALDHAETTAFPDASKLLAEKAELAWSALDLHGLLWQYLLNADGNEGTRLRDHVSDVTGAQPTELDDTVWTLPNTVRSHEPSLRKLFESLAGPWMGKNPRRGATFPWIVTHLADANGRTAPRPFLRAIGVAAERTEERYPDHDRPLHVESIKAGVQEASRGRVNELLEDHAWAADPMQSLGGLNVPCDFDDVVARWIDRLGSHPPASIVTDLSPNEANLGWAGVRAALERIGVFERLRDERVNLPDLYRVGLSIGRKGGVRPVVRR